MTGVDGRHHVLHDLAANARVQAIKLFPAPGSPRIRSSPFASSRPAKCDTRRQETERLAGFLYNQLPGFSRASGCSCNPTLIRAVLWSDCSSTPVIQVEAPDSASAGGGDLHMSKGDSWPGSPEETGANSTRVTLSLRPLDEYP